MTSLFSLGQTIILSNLLLFQKSFERGIELCVLTSTKNNFTYLSHRIINIVKRLPRIIKTLKYKIKTRFFDLYGQNPGLTKLVLKNAMFTH